MEKGYNIDDILSEVKKRREEAEAKIKSDSDEKEIVGSLANDEPTVEPTPEPIEEPVEEPEVEIPEEEVPMAQAPETGDVSALWLALTALSGTGLAGLAVLGRKKREDEE